MLTMACGVSIMFIIGPVLYWRLLALIGMAPCLLQLLGLFFVPESPRWLANMGRRKEAEGALQRLWGRNADISKEAAEIEVTHFVKIDLSTDEHVYIYIYFFFLVRPILQAFKSCHRTDSSTYFSKNMHVHLLCISHSWIYNSCHNSADSNHPGYILNGQIRKTTPTTGGSPWIMLWQYPHRILILVAGVWWILFARPGRDTMGYDVRDISCKPDGLSQQHRELGQLGRFMGRGVYLQWFLPVELSRRVFLLCECLLVRDNLCCENGTGNEGANNGRRTSFYEPVTLTRQIVNYLHDLLQW
ncbi:uncharacterized protein LOC116192638 isoform X5 [Punica granatum]|uniref:Uncharacterized protein LOC116192638 isoform X5 n=1 Tax=Punica granatum TaxID=22663 RepID=A0A6P8C7J1_PUNGR|nr:uncharacterized protein LOC116192638 isoform X5 [Punica granatum]